MTKILIISEGFIVGRNNDLKLSTIALIWDIQWMSIKNRLVSEDSKNGNQQYEFLRNFLTDLEYNKIIPYESTFELNARYIKTNFCINNFEVLDD